MKGHLLSCRCASGLDVFVGAHSNTSRQAGARGAFHLPHSSSGSSVDGWSKSKRL
jgi:hypothetical protein